MSIVGPRPERPEIAAEYEKEMPEFRLRLQARAGLTGYAQVYLKPIKMEEAIILPEKSYVDMAKSAYSTICNEYTLSAAQVQAKKWL